MWPCEMTQYPSWVVWKLVEIPGRAKPQKIPYSAVTGGPADSTDPSHWTTYAVAKEYYRANRDRFNGLGFVFSAADPYVGIDLDAPEDEAQKAQVYRVLEAFKNTYQERSPSKTGFHIIALGEIANERKRKPVEMYATARYFTMTGDVYNDAMITRNDFMLQHLWYDLGGARKLSGSVEAGTAQKYSDEQIYEMGCNANGEKNPGPHFHALFHGQWAQYHPSHSQADLALVNMLSFYSRNPEQIRRMFLASDLGKRPKAHRGPTGNKKIGYLDEMIQKSFDKMDPEISIDGLLDKFEEQLKAERDAAKAAPTPMLGHGWELPPGILGEIAEFIYQSAPRPVKEVALAAAIGLMAGICGRAYNVSNTGLNQYILVLASTGIGKEAAKSGISRIIKEVKKHIPVAGDFIGPAAIASGQALIKFLQKNACFVSILGEFGLTLQQLCGPMANSSQVMLRQVLLDLYNKSGIHQDLQGSIYSDKSNNTDIVMAPNMSLVGETTPDSYFPFLDDYMIAQGLIPRFMCIEYTGNRGRLNKAHASVVPSEKLIADIVTMMTNSLSCQQYGKAIEVKTTKDAEIYIDEFDRYCDDKSNASDEGVGKHMWTRGHVKLLKLAALIAVGCHVYEPVITLEHAQWARNLVEKDIVNVLQRFSNGSVGSDSSETQQILAVVSIIKDYALRPYDAPLKKYVVDEAMHKQHVLTMSYIQRRLLQKSCFVKDARGATVAIKRALESLVNDGAIIELKSHVMMEKFNSTAKAFVICDLSRFNTTEG